jgi:hypothetical protein
MDRLDILLLDRLQHKPSGAAECIKRRTNVVGIFPNDGSITRLVGAMMLEQNDEWSLNRRCMQLEGLQTLSDTLVGLLPFALTCTLVGRNCRGGSQWKMPGARSAKLHTMR